MQKSPDHLHPEINRLLQNFTKYVSKPLGFQRMYNDNNKKNEVDYATSLPLQIILFFNVYFSIVWIIGTCFVWPVLVSRMTNETLQVWIILILFAFIMMIIFELIRLYLGYLGNLCERVPELTGFWLLTLIIETPLSLFLLIIVCVPIDKSGFQIIYQIPIQFALQLIHFIFIFFENIFGLIALRVLARYQIARFHYKQFDSYRDLNDNAGAHDLDWLYNLEKTKDLNMKTQEFQAISFQKGHKERLKRDAINYA